MIRCIGRVDRWREGEMVCPEGVGLGKYRSHKNDVDNSDLYISK